MVRGLDKFRKTFKGYENQYVIIGGTACSILMEEEGLEFRATKDVDIVLIIEALNADFGLLLWKFIKDGKYEHKLRSTGEPQFYRFTHPSSNEFPAMIELFSRRCDKIALPKDAILSPLPIDDNISSLSAILLDDYYYNFMREGTSIVDDVNVLDAYHLIPFKAKAWLDLTRRKTLGELVDEKNIRKHKNDVFRLSELINPETRIVVSAEIYRDIKEFINHFYEEDLDLEQLGLFGSDKKEILRQIMQIYCLKQ